MNRVYINSKYLYHAYFASAAIGIGISFGQIYLFHVFSAILILYLLFFRPIDLFPKSNKTKFHLFFYFFILFYLISLFWAIDFMASIKYVAIATICSFLSLFIIEYCSSLERQDRLFHTLAVVFLLEIIFCLLEISTSFRLPISPYSDYLHFFGRTFPLEEMYTQEEIETFKRSATGFEWNINNLAILMQILLPFFFLHRKNSIKLFGSITCLLIILMSGSRGVFIALIFMLLSYVILYKKSLVRLLILFLFGGGLAILFLQYSKSDGFKRLVEITESFSALDDFFSSDNKEIEEGSISMRRELIAAGIADLKGSYGFGIGAGSSHTSLESKGGIGDYHLTDLHNFWIEMLVETGIVFTLIFLIWYIGLFLKLYAVGSNTNLSIKIRYFSHACSLSLLGFFISSMTASSVIYFLPMWLLLGFSVSTINIARGQNVNN